MNTGYHPSYYNLYNQRMVYGHQQSSHRSELDEGEQKDNGNQNDKVSDMGSSQHFSIHTQEMQWGSSRIKPTALHYYFYQLLLHTNDQFSRQDITAPHLFLNDKGKLWITNLQKNEQTRRFFAYSEFYNGKALDENECPFDLACSSTGFPKDVLFEGIEQILTQSGFEGSVRDKLAQKFEFCIAHPHEFFPNSDSLVDCLSDIPIYIGKQETPEQLEPPCFFIQGTTLYYVLRPDDRPPASLKLNEKTRFPVSKDMDIIPIRDPSLTEIQNNCLNGALSEKATRALLPFFYSIDPKVRTLIDGCVLQLIKNTPGNFKKMGHASYPYFFITDNGKLNLFNPYNHKDRHIFWIISSLLENTIPTFLEHSLSISTARTKTQDLSNTLRMVQKPLTQTEVDDFAERLLKHSNPNLTPHYNQRLTMPYVFRQENGMLCFYCGDPAKYAEDMSVVYRLLNLWGSDKEHILLNGDAQCQIDDNPIAYYLANLLQSHASTHETKPSTNQNIQAVAKALHGHFRPTQAPFLIENGDVYLSFIPLQYVDGNTYIPKKMGCQATQQLVDSLKHFIQVYNKQGGSGLKNISLIKQKETESVVHNMHSLPGLQFEENLDNFDIEIVNNNNEKQCISSSDWWSYRIPLTLLAFMFLDTKQAKTMVSSYNNTALADGMMMTPANLAQHVRIQHDPDGVSHQLFVSLSAILAALTYATESKQPYNREGVQDQLNTAYDNADSQQQFAKMLATLSPNVKINFPLPASFKTRLLGPPSYIEAPLNTREKFPWQSKSRIGDYAHKIPPMQDNAVQLQKISLDKIEKHVLNPKSISWLMQSLGGKSGQTGTQYENRQFTTPYAGGIRSTEIMLVLNEKWAKEMGCPSAGTYRYNPWHHGLELVSNAKGEQGDFPQMIIKGDTTNVEKKYGDRASRYMHLNHGHVLAQLQMLSAHLGVSIHPKEENLQDKQLSQTFTLSPTPNTQKIPKDLPTEQQIFARRSADLKKIDPSRIISQKAFHHVINGLRQKEASSAALALLVAVHAVEGMKPGLYRVLFSPDSQQATTFELVEEKNDIRRCSQELGYDQNVARDAVFNVFVCAAIQNLDDTEYCKTLHEAGKIGQDIYFVADDAGLSVRPLGAYTDGAFRVITKEGVEQHFALLYPLCVVSHTA